MSDRDGKAKHDRPAPDPDRVDPAIWKIMSVTVLGSFLAQLDATLSTSRFPPLPPICIPNCRPFNG
jgi:hypothetical protein